MTFVNESISEEDFRKYELDSIDKRYVVGGVRSRQWTIDRERDIYLRVVSRGREEISHRSIWTLYWKGALLVVELDLMSTTGGPGQSSSARYQLRRLELPESLEAHRQQVLSDLKDALTAYKDGGVYATASQFVLVLDI